MLVSASSFARTSCTLCRRSEALEALITILYLKDISTSDFERSSLSALVGADALVLSASTIARLKEAWSCEHDRWRKRDLSAKQCLLVG